jgi:hypothetical protein
MIKKSNLILLIVSTIFLLLITIFEFNSFLSKFAPFSMLIPILLLGIISFEILNLYSFKKWIKVVSTIVLTIILWVLWIFIMILFHGVSM